MVHFILRTAFLGLLLVGAGYAQDKVDAETFWNKNIIKTIEGSGQLQLEVDGIQSGIVWGIRPEIRNLLSQFPDSRQGLEDFDHGYVTGQFLTWGGFTVWIGGLAFFESQELGHNPQPVPAAIGAGVAVVGLITEFVGVAAISSSYQRLFEGVNQYNKEEFERFTQASE